MDLTAGFATLVTLIGLALVFDFLNGFHDAANSIATVVSTGVLRPYQAVVWAACFNFLAFALFKLSVAATIGKGILDPHFVDAHVIFGALMGAISWNLITWYYGMPSSSSHALIGGMIGAGVAKAGTAPLLAPGILKTVAFIVISPVLGLLLGALTMIGVSWLFFRRSPRHVDNWFRRLQLLSSALYSIGHGSNDAQKTMGVIWLMLIASGATSSDHLPMWVVASCYFAMALGTLFGGWRIVKTMGSGITRLQPVGGFCAETAAATTIFLATFGGIPISTTHAITGSILGVGTTRGVRSVRWIWGQRIVIAWVLTIPCSAFMATVAYFLVHKLVEPWFG
jgi:inorganic phosphate transporter, PiT family